MIARRREKKRLEILLASNEAEFLAVTGRRRVGKTYLVDTLLGGHYCFDMTGLLYGDTKAQLVNFTASLLRYAPDMDPDIPENWQFAFLRLRAYLDTLPTNRKQVIFIDELPWVATPRSNFVQTLAHLWNSYLSKHAHFMLVICGSATSWITKNILGDAGGMHNRVTELLYLEPFNIAESKAYLEERGVRLKDSDLAQTYMAFGGIPFYLKNVRPGDSFVTAIERSCFQSSGRMTREYGFLYDALFKDAELHKSIVATLANFPNGLTRQRLLKEGKFNSNGSFNRAINELTDSGFIEWKPSFNKKKKEGIYQLIDEFSAFYQRFMTGKITYRKGMWQQIAVTPKYRSWTGHAFELFCAKHVSAIKKALDMGSIYLECSHLAISKSESFAGCQIDLILDRADNMINLCEIKFRNKPFAPGKEDAKNILNKRWRFEEYTKTDKQVVTTMVTNRGVVENDNYREAIDNQLTLAEIIRFS